MESMPREAVLVNPCNATKYRYLAVDQHTQLATSGLKSYQKEIF